MSIRGLLETITQPSTRFALGTLVVIGGLLGLVAIVAFEVVMTETSTDEFCNSCHEIGDNSGAEYVGTIHHTNELGLKVTCSDCHIPKAFLPKMWRKIRAANEVYHKVLGTIDTPEKFEAHRMRMATFTWADMKSNDSRECRHCHDQSRWVLENQSEKAQRYHKPALARGKTCIDCHKGVAHKLPQGIEADTPLEDIEY